MTPRQRFVPANATLGVALATLGCDTQAPDANDDGETGGEGFELVAASFDVTGQFVTLRFSEPVGPVADVEPSAFRISLALPTELCSDNGCAPETTYWDPNFYASYYFYYSYEPGSSYAPFVVDLIAAGAEPTEVSLRFAEPFDPMVCEGVFMYSGLAEFLFVHYAPGDIPLRSVDGESLAAIGPQWVEQMFPVFTAEGDFPNLDPKISIPCGG